MEVYIIAQLSFTYRDAYDAYQRGFFDVFRQYRGELLAADEQAEVLEGEWHGDKVVLMSFPDEAAAREFIDSPAYREISVLRRAGAKTTALLVRGLARMRRGAPGRESASDA
ncbi:MAG TPA: DUF1330 domain-containing protein [Dehalococcoidia bacterium]|nr:DUF1330 domain-containing protein [Dehalococcoidia bacterium]